MPEDYNQPGESLKSWIPTIIMLFCFPPVGIVLLIIKLFGLSGGGRGRRGSGQHPYDRQRAQAQGEYHYSYQETSDASTKAQPQGEYHYGYQAHAAPGASAKAQAKEDVRQVKEQIKEQVRRAKEQTQEEIRRATEAAKHSYTAASKPSKKDKKLRSQAESGKGLVTGGVAIAAVFALGSLAVLTEVLTGENFWDDIVGLFACLGFFGGGLVMIYYGLDRTKKARRYRKYLALIGRRESISVVTLAQAMGVSVHRACGDLQAMLDRGLFPTGFLDMGSGRLVLNGDGLPEEPVAKPQEEPAAPKGMEREDAALMEIKQLNDAIADPEMSGKIDRIGEITGKIFTYLREKPDREGQLRSFLSYYLPTTLKILRAYAQMEAQGIEGENITAAKERIEGMMDKVVDGFEKQLDKLFQDDAMDITTDVAVLERMLDKDGLGGGQTLQMGG